MQEDNTERFTKKVDKKSKIDENLILSFFHNLYYDYVILEKGRTKF
jgi:hypothetical protein